MSVSACPASSRLELQLITAKVYEDAHGRTEKLCNHDILLPHEILASLFRNDRMHMLVGHGSVPCLTCYNQSAKSAMHTCPCIQGSG